MYDTYNYDIVNLHQNSSQIIQPSSTHSLQVFVSCKHLTVQGHLGKGPHPPSRGVKHVWAAHMKDLKYVNSGVYLRIPYSLYQLQIFILAIHLKLLGFLHTSNIVLTASSLYICIISSENSSEEYLKFYR